MHRYFPEMGRRLQNLEPTASRHTSPSTSTAPFPTAPAAADSEDGSLRSRPTCRPRETTGTARHNTFVSPVPYHHQTLTSCVGWGLERTTRRCAKHPDQPPCPCVRRMTKSKPATPSHSPNTSSTVGRIPPGIGIHKPATHELQRSQPRPFPPNRGVGKRS